MEVSHTTFHSYVAVWNANIGARFLDIGLAPRVRHSFHALALDEHRSSFYPSLWWKHPEATYKKGKKSIEPELIQCWFLGHHGDVGGGSKNHKISNLALGWMIDQCTSRNLLDFDIRYIDPKIYLCETRWLILEGFYRYLKEITASTRDPADLLWGTNKDPFYAGFIPSAMWTVVGSRLRMPGREPIPVAIRPGSKTCEYIHYSVRQKMEEGFNSLHTNSDCNVCIAKDFPSPSKAMEGFDYDWEQKAWVS